MGKLTRQLLPFGTLILFIGGLSILEPETFLTLENFLNVLRRSSVPGIIALAMTFVIISGGIDLSVGSMLAIAGMIGGLLLSKLSGWPYWMAAFAASFMTMVTGAVCGLMNGTMITKLKLPPFIVTLGTMSAFRGISYVMNDGQPYDMPTYRYLGEGVITLWKTLEAPKPEQFALEVERVLWPWQNVDLSQFAERSRVVSHGIPVSVLIFVVLIAAAGFVLKYTRLGRYTYAIGSNKQAAFHSGINVDLNLVAIYALTGLFTGIAAMIQNSRTVSAQPTAGQAMELDVIAAVVIGGASLSGGRGTLTGTVIGILLISFLRNGCTLLGISTNIQLIVIGAIIIVAVSVDQLARSRVSAIDD
ncbi:MAG TPA: ABC transporter permease [Anaerohalosphaeraceae bacterium]|jgi:ribose/xylose/arabinose/galactoside ABC-type transport system permease subunit|nr:ABC transporter permease [Anaerohalosphaeraceae bacterium]HRT51494.1 ABC transporter permease [Anaerohalosphaeraceae bacterium]HRT87171.1 ABC transporter permease [Anaerohalosphaeraceae bacterium]